jgi:RNA polymerase sigma factor (sigma-70 family)
MRDDAELLRQYVHTASEDAFTELVQRHLPVVYSSALRQTGGDVELAKDICQTVFIDLGRKARSLLGHELLIGWLFTATRFAAATMLRGSRRRQIRESIAASMHESPAEPAVEDPRLASALDEAMGELPSEDRNAVLLRFFQGKSLKEVAAVLGINEDAARMRVSRALETLHGLLKQRGVALSAAALGTALAAQAVAAAPAGLAASVAATALASAAGSGGITATLVKLMTMTKVKFGIIGVIAVAGVATPLVIQHQSQARLREENEALRQQASQVDQVSAENERLSNLVVQAKGAEPLSREQMNELLRLRGEVGRLRREGKQLETLQAENRQLRERLASIPAVAVARDAKPLSPEEEARNGCINNLRHIDGAIQQYALENKLTADDTVTAEQILPYLKDTNIMRCPLGGTYGLGRVGDKPTCSMPGHALPSN